MSQKSSKILIVEDDKSFAQVLETYISKLGYAVSVASNATQAMRLLSYDTYACAFIDCMLPQKNGVDLAQDIQTEYPGKTQIVLMSGIFKDKGFIKDAVRKTSAEQFLSKPFELEQIHLILDRTFGGTNDSLNPVKDHISQTQWSADFLSHTLRSADHAQGFELPFYLGMLLHSDLTGQLNIITTNSKIATLEVYKGQVGKVLMKDNDSYFGVLIVENGFASVPEVKTALLEKSPLPIGERLIAKNILSPHNVEMIQKQQMAIRLSKLIQSSDIQLSFIETSSEPPSASLESADYPKMLSDWLCAKLSDEWLETYFFKLGDYKLEVNSNAEINSLPASPLAPFLPQLMDQAKSGQSIAELALSFDPQKDLFYRSLYYALALKVVRLGDVKAKSSDHANKLDYVLEFEKKMSNKNHYDLLGVGPRTPKKEISKAFHEIAKNFHPDKVPDSAPQELKDAVHRVFARVTEAYQTLSDENKLQAYKDSIKRNEAEQALLMENDFEEAVQNLEKNQIGEAFRKLAELKQKKFKRNDFLIYFIWAQIKVNPTLPPTQRLSTEEIGDLFNGVPPEERHNARYYLIKGLYLELTKQMEKSVEFFRHAIEIDKSFPFPRRELLRIKSLLAEQERSGSSNKLFGRLFGKNRAS